MTLDMDHLSSWIGKTEVMHETLSSELVERFNATLGSQFSASTGDPAPLLIHLCPVSYTHLTLPTTPYV